MSPEQSMSSAPSKSSQVCPHHHMSPANLLCRPIGGYSWFMCPTCLRLSSETEIEAHNAKKSLSVVASGKPKDLSDSLGIWRRFSFMNTGIKVHNTENWTYGFDTDLMGVVDVMGRNGVPRTGLPIDGVHDYRIDVMWTSEGIPGAIRVKDNASGESNLKRFSWALRAPLFLGPRGEAAKLFLGAGVARFFLSEKDLWSNLKRRSPSDKNPRMLFHLGDKGRFGSIQSNPATVAAEKVVVVVPDNTEVFWAPLFFDGQSLDRSVSVEIISSGSGISLRTESVSDYILRQSKARNRDEFLSCLMRRDIPTSSRSFASSVVRSSGMDIPVSEINQGSTPRTELGYWCEDVNGEWVRFTNFTIKVDFIVRAYGVLRKERTPQFVCTVDCEGESCRVILDKSPKNLRRPGTFQSLRNACLEASGVYPEVRSIKGGVPESAWEGICNMNVPGYGPLGVSQDGGISIFGSFFPNGSTTLMPGHLQELLPSWFVPDNGSISDLAEDMEFMSRDETRLVHAALEMIGYCISSGKRKSSGLLTLPSKACGEWIAAFLGIKTFSSFSSLSRCEELWINTMPMIYTADPSPRISRSMATSCPTAIGRNLIEEPLTKDPGAWTGRSHGKACMKLMLFSGGDINKAIQKINKKSEKNQADKGCDRKETAEVRLL